MLPPRPTLFFGVHHWYRKGGGYSLAVSTIISNPLDRIKVPGYRLAVVARLVVDNIWYMGSLLFG